MYIDIKSTNKIYRKALHSYVLFEINNMLHLQYLTFIKINKEKKKKKKQTQKSDQELHSTLVTFVILFKYWDTCTKKKYCECILDFGRLPCSVSIYCLSI